jgi:hypothetical protein
VSIEVYRVVPAVDRGACARMPTTRLSAASIVTKSANAVAKRNKK